MLNKNHIYTALIGIFGILFALVSFNSTLPSIVKFLLTIFGIIVFVISVRSLYLAVNNADNREFIPLTKKEIINNINRINKVDLINENGTVIDSWELYDKTSLVIGKDIGENQVDIDLSQNPYASMIEIEHAVLNYAEGNWYIEDLGSQNGISIMKKGSNKKYKLSSLQPCKLDFGDVIFIGMCQLKLN